MFRSYQFKWFFILAGILTFSTVLLRQENPGYVTWWQYLQYAFSICSSLLAGWLIHGYFLLNNFPGLKSYVRYLMSIGLAIVAIFTLSYLMYKFLPTNPLNGKVVGFETFADFKAHFTGAFFVSLICYVVFYSTHTNTALQDSKLENEVLEQAHLRAQLISLQQQISPHFLFNSLSTLKTIAGDQPTKDYIVQLAGVYRYVLNFNEEYLAQLKDEISFIRSYLYIMNERFEDSLTVAINIQEDHLKLMIPSLSLQLLIENAIKHNTISPEQPLHISISTNELPALIVSNNFQPKHISTEGTGTGLKNIVERYKLLSGKSIAIDQDTERFSVTIPLLKK